MSSTTNTLANKYSAKSFFKFNFRQNIQHLILYLIVAVLVMVLPTVMMINDYYDSVSYDMSARSFARVRDCVRSLGVIGVVVSGGIAVLSGMSSLAHVNSKQNIGCYHSFPLKRETMYLTDSLTRTLYWGITMLFGYAVSYVILLAALPTDLVLRDSGVFLKLLFVAVLAFMLIYAVFLFAAGLTGTAFMRFIMIGAIFFLPLAVYAIFVVMFMAANSDLRESYYLSEEVVQYLCTPIRAYVGTIELVNDGKWLKLLLVIPESLVFYIGGMLLHKFRRTELAGTTIIWKPVWHVLKYTIIVSCTLFGAYMFDAIEGGGLSFFIGALIGAVLSLILTNALFYRSSRAMFRGLKPFAVCCAAVFVFMLLVPLNVTGKIGDFYSAGNTKELTLNITNVDADLTFDDPEEIKNILEMLEDDKIMFSDYKIPDVPVFDPTDDADYEMLDDEFLVTNYYYYSEMSGEEVEKYIAETERYMSASSYYITVTQKPKFGIPLCLRLQSDANSAFSHEIVRTEQYSEIMDVSSWIDTESITEISFNLDNRNLSVSMDELFTEDSSSIIDMGYYNDDDVSYRKAVDGLFDKAVSVLSLTRFDESLHESSPIIGSMKLYYKHGSNGSTDTFDYPIYAEDLDMLNAVSELFFLIKQANEKTDEEWQPYETTEEYYLEAIENIRGTSSYILLINTETGETKKISAEELAKLGKYTSSFVIDDTWSWSYLDRNSANKYMILYQRDDRYDLRIYFRTNAISDRELDDIFAK